MDFTDYIKPELLILVPVLYFMGLGLKANGVSARWFPLAVGLAGVLLSALYIFAACACDGIQSWLMAVFSSVTQGVLVAGASVYVHNLSEKANARQGVKSK